MPTRPIRALLGALTLATALATTATPAAPAGATGKAPPCPATPTIIVSGADTIAGTECADWIFPGTDTVHVHALGGDDRVVVEGPPSTKTYKCCGPPQIIVHLGAGDDRVQMSRANRITAYGGPGADDLRADWMADGTMIGEGGHDRLWSGSDEVDLVGSDGDDRLTVTSVTPPEDDRYWWQEVSGGDGDDLVSTFGATGPRFRVFTETAGDDTFLLRQGAADPGREEIREGVGGHGGHDVVVMDAADQLEADLFGHIERLTVGGVP